MKFEFEIPVYPEVLEELFNKYGDVVESDYVSCEVTQDILNKVNDSFNEATLEQYIWDDEIEDCVVSIRSLIEDDKLMCQVELNREPTEEEREKIVNYVNGQCSDGWGEGFEQEDIEIDGEIYHISTSPKHDSEDLSCLELYLKG